MASKSRMSQGLPRSFNVVSSSWGNTGLSLCMPVSTTTGTAWRAAARATMWEPLWPSMPPLASTACAPISTMLARAIMAKTAESVIQVVGTPSVASSRASFWPS